MGFFNTNEIEFSAMFEFIVNYIFMPILVLGIVIFVHEMGHFLMARYFKFSIPIFSIGFGKEIWGVTDKNGTRWKFSVFPLGGYVSISDIDSYPLIQRTWVAFAGPLANFIFGILIIFFCSFFYGAPKTPPVIVGLNIDAGAYQSGMLPLDEVISIDGKEIPHSMDSIKDIIYAAKSDIIDVRVIRNGIEAIHQIQIRELNKTDEFGTVYKQKMMGVIFAGQNLKLQGINSVAGVITKGNIELTRAELLNHLDKNIVLNFGEGDESEDFLFNISSELNKGWLNKDSNRYSTLVLWDEQKIEFNPVQIVDSAKEAIELTYLACKSTLGVIYQIIVGKKDTGELGGVIAISNMTAETVEESDKTGAYYILRLLALLSINIGFLNLFPVPLLDGGRIMMYGIEGVLRRPPSLRFKGYVYGASIMFIIFLMLMVTYRDITERLL
jgi:regulator of sigma E protease